MPALARTERVEDHGIRQNRAELLLHGRREHRTGRRHDHERAGIVVCTAGTQHIHHGACHRVTHKRDGRDLLLADQLYDSFRVKASTGLQDDGSAGKETNERAPLRRTVNERRRWQHRQRHHRIHGILRQLLGLLDGLARHRTALKPRKEDVLVTPHHALGHAGRAARVDNVEVVAGASLEVALRARSRQHFVKVEGFGGSIRRKLDAGVVFEQNGRLQPRQVSGRLRHDGAKLALGDGRNDICVFVEVAQLACDVSVVYVDGHRTDFERSEHALDELRAVEEMKPDVVSSSHAPRFQEVREPGRPDVELGVGQAPVAGHKRRTVGNGVGERLKEIRDIEFHRLFPFRRRRPRAVAPLRPVGALLCESERAEWNTFYSAEQSRNWNTFHLPLLSVNVRT